MYEEGTEVIQQALKLSNEGTINWYTALEIHYYLSMRMGRYEQAMAIWQEATRHKRFSAQRETTQEIWNIFGVYIFLAYRLTGRTLPEKNLPRFRAAKFLNEVPVFSQDKSGLNVAVLIAHVLLQFVEGKKDEIWERIEALEKYRERYLHSDETQRSESFIKILVAIARANFKRTQFEPKVAPLLKRLKEVNYDISNQPYEMEIIPYLNLYELVRDFSPPL
jgi:tetratricopeptide (TPR) repeat protein